MSNKEKDDRDLEQAIQEGLNAGRRVWNNPTIPQPEIAITPDDFERLGEHGVLLKTELAFMDVRTFKTYVNAPRIMEVCKANIRRGFAGVFGHECGHKFCPYDVATATLLAHRIRQALPSDALPYVQSLIPQVLNLFGDETLNSHAVSQGKGSDIIWVFQQLGKRSKPSAWWRVYAHSMEAGWNVSILPQGTPISDDERACAQSLAHFFESKPLDSTRWEYTIQEYTRLITPYLLQNTNEREGGSGGQQHTHGSESGKGQQQGQGSKKGSTEGSKGLVGRVRRIVRTLIHGKKGTGNQRLGEDSNPQPGTPQQGHSDKQKYPLSPSDICSSSSAALPKNARELEAVADELLRRLSRPGADGLPTNPHAIKELQELGAGFGAGGTTFGHAHLYSSIATWYDVQFAKKPFGNESNRRYGLRLWTASNPVDALDTDLSIQHTGRLIPGYGTVQWTHRSSPLKRGEKEVVPNTEIYLDSSGSMPDPVASISFPVLAGTVVSRTAIKKGALVQAKNFWDGEESPRVQVWTRNIDDILRVLMDYHPSGGTVFPIEHFLAQREYDPRLVLIVTDADLANAPQTCSAIQDFRSRHRQNMVVVYAINAPKQESIDSLRNAGAIVYPGSGPDIFKHMIGTAHETYRRF